MNAPEISVIVPVYNVEKYLCRCVDSILNQTFTDFELILVDDGSPDNCGAICDEYAAKDSRIRVIHQGNGGLSVARNVGIDWALANSNSEWLTFVDSDDWIHPQYLCALHEAARQGNTLIGMCSFVETATYYEFPTYEQFNYEITTPGKAYIFQSQRVTAYAWGRLYHKSLFESGIRYPIGKIWEDLFTTYKLLYLAPSIAVIEQPLYYYFTNKKGIVNSSWKPSKMDQLDGYESQIPFFLKRNENEIVIRLVQAYVNCLHANYVAVKDCNLSSKEKSVFMILLKKRMRNALRKYDKVLGITVPKYAWAYEVAYPGIMYWYWTIKAIQEKCKRGKDNARD